MEHCTGAVMRRVLVGFDRITERAFCATRHCLSLRAIAGYERVEPANRRRRYERLRPGDRGQYRGVVYRFQLSRRRVVSQSQK